MVLLNKIFSKFKKIVYITNQWLKQKFMINLISFNKLKMQKKKFSNRLSKISLYSSFQNSFFYCSNVNNDDK